MSRYTMDDVLKDEKLFRENFCLEATCNHLGNVPVEDLRATILMVHGCSGFRAAATPVSYTRGEMPVVIFGNLDRGGKMQSPRFGLTTQCSACEPTAGKKLFLYASKKALSGQHADEVVSSWRPWRSKTTDSSLAMPVPVYEGGSVLDPSFMLPGSNEPITLGDFLKLLGSQLKLKPAVCDEFADITKKLNLAPDCITPLAAANMKERNRNREK